MATRDTLESIRTKLAEWRERVENLKEYVAAPEFADREELAGWAAELREQYAELSRLAEDLDEEFDEERAERLYRSFARRMDDFLKSIGKEI